MGGVKEGGREFGEEEDKRGRRKFRPIREREINQNESLKRRIDPSVFIVVTDDAHAKVN
jgi:hypothetical protein